MVTLMQDRTVQLYGRPETHVLCVLEISLEFLCRFF